MDLLIDTNVVLDLLWQRPAGYENARELFDIIDDDDDMHPYVISTSITNIFYAARKAFQDTSKAYALLRDVFGVVEVIEVDGDDIMGAYKMHWKDFEDAVQMSVAELDDMDAVITVNKKDFEEARVPVMTPREFCYRYSRS